MTAQALEERVAILEAEVAQLKQQLKADLKATISWQEKISETFANNLVFDEAMELGRKYRQSLRLNSSEK